MGAVSYTHLDVYKRQVTDSYVHYKYIIYGLIRVRYYFGYITKVSLLITDASDSIKFSFGINISLGSYCTRCVPHSLS